MRPSLAIEWHLEAITGPSGGACTIQLAKDRTTDMFTTAPAIANGNAENTGGGVSGDYLARCLGRRVPVALDIDAVNGAAGLNVHVSFVMPWRPHEHLLERDEVD